MLGESNEALVAVWKETVGILSPVAGTKASPTDPSLPSLMVLDLTGHRNQRPGSFFINSLCPPCFRWIQVNPNTFSFVPALGS